MAFWLIGVLLPVSIGAYLTFYKLLIPQEMVQIPLQFTDMPHPEHGVIKQTHMDLVKFIPKLCKQEHVNYLIRMNLEIHCNRNRNDDIFPIIDTMTIVDTPFNASKQFLLNCDTRYIYNGNNMWVPYNLRYWIPPIFINIDKNVNIKSDLMMMSSGDLNTGLHHLVKLEVLKDVIINHDNSFLEFIIQWDGFRYYITKYYYRSLIVGVTGFYVLAIVQIALFNMMFMVAETSEDSVKTEDEGDKDDKGDKDDLDDSTNSSSGSDIGSNHPGDLNQSSDFQLHIEQHQLRPRIKQEPADTEI